MAKKCDYHIERGAGHWCALKSEEVSYSTYKEYCYYDDIENCPIYQFYRKGR